jgi:general secretion pathway protein F
MPAYSYQAINADGAAVRGVLEGDSPRQVRNKLREQGLAPLAVDAIQNQRPGIRQWRWLPARISPKDLALLTRQLATLCKSGLPLDEALLAVSQQSESQLVSELVAGVRSKVLEGRTLAQGLSQYPESFPELYRATVAAGEQAGRLDGVLERLADYTEQRQVLQSTILQAILYPVLLTTVCILIVSMLLGFVVPQMVSVFAASHQTLPLLTRILINLSAFIQHFGWLVLLALLAWVWWYRRRLRDAAVLRRLHERLWRVWIVGKLIRGVNAARFARTLAILTQASVPVLEALNIAGSVITHIPMREAVVVATSKVREGASIAKSIGASGLFPPMLVHLISSGEASGELESLLERAALNQEREMNAVIQTTMGILGPALILFMGALVLCIVLALLLPIFELNELVR